MFHYVCFIFIKGKKSNVYTCSIFIMNFSRDKFVSAIKHTSKIGPKGELWKCNN